ncbi:hypothetical protein KQI86_16810 [Clostridium sp. MSJ-11]|uniref:Uncharacterized protein n=1 Tax=Clostridium mobile TaxID=2841512 RepID=A0ABS6EL94_9CLOT|nr:hypothetical protein [Clostridium mobile]MBU5485984.1 hypothetical protein [Clostridium mobile]
MNKNLTTLVKGIENEVKDFFTDLRGKAIVIDYVAGIQNIDFINNCFITETESEIIFEDEYTERSPIVFSKDIIDNIEVDVLVGQAYISMGNIEVMIYAA